MQIDIDRQKVSRHFNLTCFSISADRHGLLAPEKNWKTSSHVLKNIPSRHLWRFPFRKKTGNFGGSKSGISDW